MGLRGHYLSNQKPQRNGIFRFLTMVRVGVYLSIFKYRIQGLAYMMYFGSILAFLLKVFAVGFIVRLLVTCN